jgi:outer membrane protein, adhesin transport system
MNSVISQSTPLKNWHQRGCHVLSALILNVGVCGLAHAQNESHTDTLQITLSQLVEQAVVSHPSVYARLAELGGSRAGVDTAKWQQYPSLSVQTERAAHQGGLNAGNSTSTTLRLQQNLWTAGRVESGINIAQFKQQAAQSAAQEARNNVALKTVDAWQSLLTSLGHQQSIEKLLLQLERLNGMMTKRVEQQISPPIDAQLLRARMAQAQSDHLTAKASADTARQRIAQWVGNSASPTIGSVNLSSSTQYALSPWPIETKGRLESAVTSSPSLLRYQADTWSTGEEIRQKRADLWPIVYARVDRQFSGANIFGNKTAENSLYVGLQYSTGAGLTVRSQIEAVQAKFLSLESDREALKRQIFETYDSEWRDYQATLERIKYAQLIRSSNDALFDSYTRLFVAGRRSWLELLNALREQSTADQTLADLLSQQQASHFRLGLYLGQLPWQTTTQP